MTDWSFVNDIPLCQIQIYAGPMPHAVNLNCMATPEGALFLSCGNCEHKFWGRHVSENAHGRLRLNGKVYPVVFTRVKDEALLTGPGRQGSRSCRCTAKPPTTPPLRPTRNGPRSGARFSCARPWTSARLRCSRAARGRIETANR